MFINKKKYNFDNDWAFDLIEEMPKDHTYIFTTKCGITIFVEHDCNLDTENTYGWSISVFDKDMNDLNYYGMDNIDDLESDFKCITRDIYGYMEDTMKHKKYLHGYKQLENKKGYCLNDFPCEDVAHDTAMAEIKDEKIFDEFGNLVIDLDSKKALDLENANGFVVDLTTQESCNEIISDIFSGESDDAFDYIMTLKLEKQRELIVKYFTNTYKYVFVKAPNVYQVVEEDLFIKE